METTKRARDVIAKYMPPDSGTATTASDNRADDNDRALQASLKHLESNDKELIKLQHLLRQRLKAQRRREKLRARAMFGGGASPASIRQSALLTEEKKEVSSDNGSSDGAADSPPSDFATAAATTAEASTVSSPLQEPPADTPSKSGVVQSKSLLKTQKKTVSFSDDKKGEQEQELEWYQDREVVAGLGLFTAALGVTMLVGHYLFLARRR
jgi:hypothetical protein